jgi:hypothetical protein
MDAKPHPLVTLTTKLLATGVAIVSSFFEVLACEQVCEMARLLQMPRGDAAIGAFLGYFLGGYLLALVGLIAYHPFALLAGSGGRAVRRLAAGSCIGLLVLFPFVILETSRQNPMPTIFYGFLTLQAGFWVMLLADVSIAALTSLAMRRLARLRDLD